MTEDNESPSVWPAYSIGSKDHLHAVGVLVANWNEVERAYQCLIQYAFLGNVKLALRTFELLGNDQRMAFIRQECIPLATGEFAEHLNHFLACAGRCKENRNAIAHANFNYTADVSLLKIDRGRSKDGNSVPQYNFELSELRKIADEIHAVAEYGIRIWMALEILRTNHAVGGVPPHAAATLLLASPGKPAQPRKWSHRSRSIPQAAQHPLPPSDE